MIIACPECNREVSDLATMCPHCGFDFDMQRQKQDEEKAHAETMRNQAIEAERQREYDLHFLPNKFYLMAPWFLKPLFRPLVFAGRAPRIELGAYLFFYIISTLVSILVVAYVDTAGCALLISVYIVYGLVCLFSCIVRRYHDAIHLNYSPVTYLVALICLAIPGIGWVASLWILELLNPSMEGSNKYGANPFTYNRANNIGHPKVKSNAGNNMNRSIRPTNVLREFEWRRFAPVEKIQAAYRNCMRYTKHANYYNSAPVGAREYITLIFYASVYPDAIDENSYARQSDEVLRCLNEEDLMYLIKCEADDQLREVFMTRLSEIRKLNNIREAQKDVSRDNEKLFRNVLKWIGIGIMGVAVISLIYVFFVDGKGKNKKGTVSSTEEGKSDLVMVYRKLETIKSTYGEYSIEYIEARIDAIRKYTLKINQGMAAKHQAFMSKVKEAGYAVTVMDYDTNGTLVGIGVHNWDTGESGTLRMFGTSLYHPRWIPEAYAMAIWEHFHDEVLASSELTLANTEKLIAKLEAQLCVLRSETTNSNTNDLKVVGNKKTYGKVRLWEGGPYWADRNIGAEKPWDEGYHFWWGDILGYKFENNIWVASDGSDSGFSFGSDNKKMFYGELTSFGFNGELVSALRREGWIVSQGGVNVLTSKHDAAHVQWGGEWRMPTEEEMKDLCNKCDWIWTEMNGVKGVVVRGRGAYASAGIFLPAAGKGYDREKIRCGIYWSSSCLLEGKSGHNGSPWALLFNDSGVYNDSRDNHLWNEASCHGCSIRPVQGGLVKKILEKEMRFNEPNPSSSHCGPMMNKRHQKIQLWEDGPYWADTNIGAEKPWEYGSYFWFGDTIGYKHGDSGWEASSVSSPGFSFSGNNTPTDGQDIPTLQRGGWVSAEGVLSPKHDAAHVLWGKGWRMPTIRELGELKANCDWIWTTTNGVNGYVVRGRDNYASVSIFLPAAGNGDGSSLHNASSRGSYWSSVPYSDYESLAWCCNFDSNSSDMYGSNRYYGRTIRPVQGRIADPSYRVKRGRSRRP